MISILPLGLSTAIDKLVTESDSEPPTFKLKRTSMMEHDIYVSRLGFAAGAGAGAGAGGDHDEDAELLEEAAAQHNNADFNTISIYDYQDPVLLEEDDLQSDVLSPRDYMPI